MLRVSMLLLKIFLFFVECKQGYGPGDQDWNYIDVRDGAHMFYWLHYTTANVKNYTQRPLVLWLQGGPATAATGMGNFAEIGSKDIFGNNRNYSWIEFVNVLFVDSPIGSGFSYVDNYFLFARSNNEIALDLVAFMKGFYKLHPEFVHVPVHLFCESYGGKMCVEFALELHKAIIRNEVRSNLKSVNMGNPWISAEDYLPSYAPFLYESGLIDEESYDMIEKESKTITALIQQENWPLALFHAFETQLRICKLTEGISVFDTQGKVHKNSHGKCVDSVESHQAYHDLMRGPVSKTLNIPRKVKFDSQKSQVQFHIYDELLKSSIHIVNELLDKTEIQISVYSGVHDLVCPISGTLRWISKLQWKRKSEYIKAERRGFYLNDILRGFHKRGGKFSMFWILNCGHLVSIQQPEIMRYIGKTLMNI